MARISTYPVDSTLTNVDKLIGTNDSGNTVQVSTESVVTFVNESGKLEGNVSSRFTYIPYIGGTRPQAALAFEAASADSVSFSSITDFVISRYTVNDKDYANYWNAVNGSTIIIQKASDISVFGIFDVTDVNENSSQSGFYDFTLTHIKSNGGLDKGTDYFVFLLQLSAGDLDKNYVHNQPTASTTWNVQHGLSKKPSVTVVDSGDNEVIGEVTYLDNNNINISFSAAFSGKAYLN